MLEDSFFVLHKLKNSWNEWIKFLKRNFFGFLQLKKTTEDHHSLSLLQKKINLLMEITSDCIVIAKNNMIIDVNKAVEKMIQIPKNKLLGTDIYNYIIPETLRKIENSKNQYTVILKKICGNNINAHVLHKNLRLEGNIIDIFNIKQGDSVENQIFKAVLEAEERERLHFSGEIHDGLGPAITVLQIYFQWLADASEDNRQFIIEKGNFYFNEVVNQLKEITQKHNPLVIETYGIIKALDLFIAKINATHTIRIIFNNNIKKRFNIKLEVAIYRIITELINNTLKYAQASHIKLNLHYDEKKQLVNLNYKDDGKGLNLNNLNNKNYDSFGLLYIKNRVKAFNGEFNLKNEENRGIRIYISIPLFN